VKPTCWHNWTGADPELTLAEWQQHASSWTDHFRTMYRLPQGMTQPSQAKIRVEPLVPKKPDRKVGKLYWMLMNGYRCRADQKARQGPRYCRQEVRRCDDHWESKKMRHAGPNAAPKPDALERTLNDDMTSAGRFRQRMPAPKESRASEFS
jgi:hypothetical protein